jgi:hypothetical protein
VSRIKFHSAIRGGDPEIIRIIDDQRAEPPSAEILSVALQSFQFDVVEWLANEKFIDLLTTKITRLARIASNAGKLPAILFLIRHRLKPTLSNDLSPFIDVLCELCSLGSTTVLG